MYAHTHTHILPPPSLDAAGVSCGAPAGRFPRLFFVLRAEKFPDMPCMKRVYRGKKASVHWSAARNEERPSSRGYTADKPRVNRSLCSSIDLNRLPFRLRPSPHPGAYVYTHIYIYICSYM